MSDFHAEITRRIADAQENLRAARTTGDSFLENVRSGELESLLRLAREHDVPIHPDLSADPDRSIDLTDDPADDVPAASERAG